MYDPEDRIVRSACGIAAGRAEIVVSKDNAREEVK